MTPDPATLPAGRELSSELPKRRKIDGPTGRRRQQIMARLRERDGDGCQICGRPFTRFQPPTIDHIRERAEGGTNRVSNLRLAHAKCNKFRSTDPQRLQRLLGIWAKQFPDGFPE